MMYGDELGTGTGVEHGHRVPNDYLPNLAGRWKNLRINAPHEESLEKMATIFLQQQEKEFDKVLKAHAESLQHDDEVKAMRNQIECLTQRLGQLEGHAKVAGSF